MAKFFDSHLHIIDPAFPLVANNGFLPEAFRVADYRRRLSGHELVGGAVVSGSFQAFDQSYLIAALKRLGAGYVGVTQLPAGVSDDEILRLDRLGVRAVRFNLRRGGSAELADLKSLSARVYELAGWHTELYVDSVLLDELEPKIRRLPRVSIDHLGLSKAGLPALLRFVEAGGRVKACGFGRCDFAPVAAMQAIVRVDAGALMFGSDLPSTRARRPFRDADIALVMENFSADLARRIFSANALDWYGVAGAAGGSGSGSGSGAAEDEYPDARIET